MPKLIAEAIPQNTAQLHARFCDLILRGYLYLATVGLGASLFRAIETGWQPLYGLHISLALLVIALYPARHKFSPRVVTLLLISLTYIVGIPGLITLGLAGHGMTWVSIGLLLIATQYPLRTALYASGATMLCAGLIAAGWMTGYLRFPVDANAYLIAPAPWIGAIVGTLPFMILIGISFAMLQRSTLQLLAETATQAAIIEVAHRELHAANHEQNNLGRELEAIFESTAIGIGLLKDGALIRANHSLAKLLGYQQSELIGTPLVQLIDNPDDIATYANEPVRERQLKRKDGSLTWVRRHMQPLDPQRPDEGTVLFIEDIAARHAADRAIQESSAKLVASVQQLEKRDHAAILLSRLGEHLLSSQSQTEALQLFADCCATLLPEASGALALHEPESETLRVAQRWGNAAASPLCETFQPSSCWGLRHNRSYLKRGDEAFGTCQHYSQTPQCHSLCIPLAANNHQLGIAWFSFPTTLSEPALDADSQLARAVTAVFRSGLANLRLRETLTNDAIRDALTGLYNRRHLHEQLTRSACQARRNLNSYAVAMLDLDNFKRLNDSFGHDAGDAALRALSRLLADNLRESDIAFRLGGEEFVILMPATEASGALACIEHLRQRWEQSAIEHAGKSLGKITFSAGIATGPEQGDSAEEILKAADIALYAAKAAGRNRVHCAGAAAPAGTPPPADASQAADDPQ